ncbi:hypothetical protein [Treponema bryantii]|uniref:hypothetical protein n=1 Tax=Treponema bryantii TaxID=163 RepID=UPI002B2E3FEF|nr:hypothetical protein TRBR_09920 [Treponema bryantii]
MQELRSTDILDKEIQADARKKAERMLQKADRDCETLIASVEADIQKAADEKKAFFNNKLNSFETDRKAVVPLEKERFKVSFIQNAIIQNINKYLEGLSEEKRLELASRNFDFKTEHKVNAYVYGFSPDAAKKFLSKKLGDKLLSCSETKFGAFVLEEDLGLSKPEGMILESEDKNFRRRLTINEVIEKLLDTNRAELSTTLFGGDL